MISIAEEAIDAIKERDRLAELRSATEDVGIVLMDNTRESESATAIALSDSSNDLRYREQSRETTYNDSS